MDDRLARLISEHNLDAHRDRFAVDDIDLQAMAAMLDADLNRLADSWKLPFGARARLRALRDRAREELNLPTAPSAVADAISGIDQELVELLPTPLARAVNEVLKPVGDRTNNDVQAAVDVLLRSLALVCQSDYFHSTDWYDPEINEMFPSLEQRPSHGTWMRFIALCVTSARRAGHSCFLRELPDTWQRCEFRRPIRHETSVFDEFGQQVRRGGGIGMLEVLIHHRNSLAHHRTDSRDLRLATQFRQRCLDVFREFRWLGRYELWLGSASKAYLLQGTLPREAVAGPALLSGDRDVALRRLRGSDPRDWEVLPMPPLILPAAAVPSEARESGSSDSEVIIFSELVSRKGGGDPRINYTSDPFAPKHVSIETAHGTNELRRLQDRKSFPRIGRGALDREDLVRRIRAASERTLRVLASSGKFRPRLHVERLGYEPRLSPWINSTLPLLGLAAEAGAGKTGILASLASRWMGQSAAPVLFVLANQHQAVRDLDRLVQDALTLGRDVTVSDVCAHCSGLVIVIDGLNEHPGREDLVFRICSLAQSTLDSVNGPRFAMTWRTEDDEWIRESSGRRSLWWVPEDVNARIDAEIENVTPEAARDSPPLESGQDSDAQTPSGGALTSIDTAEPSERPSARRTESDEPTYVRIGPLTYEECAQAWRRYRDDADLRLRPEFDWDDVRRQSPDLARRLRNPLWMRVLMECMHGKDLPQDLGETDVFSTYLEQIRQDYAACRADQMLDALGRVMLRRRSLHITLDDLERECWELVHPPTGQSPLVALERRGVLSSIDGRSFTFTVERLAEQVVGEHVAALPAAENGVALSKLASELYRSKFSQAHGVIQEALHQRVRALGADEGERYLFGFIDACPPERADLAAAALERRIVEAGEVSAAFVVECLLEDPTESDLEVAANAAKRLMDRGLQDLALAFIVPFITPERITLMGASIRYRRLLMLYVNCVWSRLANGDDEEPTWLDRDHVRSAVDSLRREDSRSPTSAGKRLLAMALVDLAHSRPSAALVNDKHGTLREALHACRDRVELASSDGDRDDLTDARKQLAAYLRLMSDSLDGEGQHDERERLLLEALAAGTAIGDDEAWDASPVLWDLAILNEHRGKAGQAIEFHRQCLEIERKRRRWWHASQTSFRIGRLLFADGRAAAAAQAEARALELARASGSRHDLATALEWYGDALRERGQSDAAMGAYQESLRVGSEPCRAEGWSPASVLAEIARMHSDRGERAEAVTARRRAVDVLRDADDRRQLAIALEYLGHALREAGLHREAIAEYMESHDVGTLPEPVERWRSNISLHWAARCHHALGQLGEAVALRSDVVRAARSAGDRAELAESLEWLACDLRDARRFEEAALAFGEAFEVGMHPEPLERWRPSGILWRHASMEADLGNHDRSIRLISLAVELSRTSGDRMRIAEDLDSMGDLLKRAGRRDDALARYIEAIDVGMTPDRATGWSPAVPLSDAADVLAEIERWDEAIDYRKRAIQAFDADEDRRGKAVELDLLGDALRAAGRSEEALQAYQDAIAVGTTPDRATGWSPAVPLADAADVLAEMGRWDEAIDCRQRAVEVCSADGDRRGTAVALECLGRVLRDAGRLEEALSAFLRSHHTGITPEPVADWKAGFPLSSAAGLLRNLQRWDEAIDCRRHAIDAFEADGDRRRTAVELELLGDDLVEAGRLEEALDAYLKSHETGMNPERVEEWQPGIPLRGAARVLGRLNRWDEAADCRRRAADGFHRDGNRRACTVELEFWGHALQESGRLEEALDAYLKSHETGMNPERVERWQPGIPLSGAARVLGRLKRWDEAVDCRRRAIDAFEAVGDRRGTADELDLLGDDLVEAGRLEDALDAYLKSHETGMTPERVEEWQPGLPLSGAARALGMLKRWDEAVDCRRRAIDAFGADGDRRRTAVELDLLGDDLVEAGRLEEALDAYLKSHETGMNPERVEEWQPGIPLSGAARVLGRLKRWDEAADCRRRAAEAFRRDSNRRACTIELEYWGRALQESGRLEEALDAYLKSHETGITPERVERWQPGIPLSGAARALGMLKRWDEAIDCRRRAIDAFDADEDRRRKAVELDLLGDALRAAGRSEEALQAYQDAIDVGMTPDRATGWSPAVPLSDAADVLAEMGRWDEAIDCRRRAADAFEADGDRRRTAIALDLLGDGLVEGGRLEEAVDAYLKSHETGMNPERVEDWEPGIPLRDAARALAVLKRWDEAADCRRRAADAFRGDGSRRACTIELEYWGHALQESGRLEEALAAFLNSHETGMNPERVEKWQPGIPLAGAAEALEQLERWDEAADFRRRAALAFHADGDRLGGAREFEFLGDNLVEAARLDEAIDAYLKSHETGMKPEPVANWDSARPLLEAARTLEHLGRDEDAGRMWQAAVDAGLLGLGQAGDGNAESTLVCAALGLGRSLAARDGNIAALEAMEAGREPALLIERLEQPQPWLLEPCADWWTLQSTLLAAIGDRTEAEAAATRAAAIRARIGESDES